MQQHITSHKAQRYYQHSWAFCQLRQCVAYKAQDAGVPLVLSDPAYISKIYHGCGARGHRTALTFSCTRCGYVGDADYHAACNIAAAKAVVTQLGRATSLSA